MHIFKGAGGIKVHRFTAKVMRSYCSLAEEKMCDLGLQLKAWVAYLAPEGLIMRGGFQKEHFLRGAQIN